MIVAAIPLIVAAIAGVVLFTNVDEVISESIEIDTSTLNLVANTWPIDSICDVHYAKYLELAIPNHSQWYLDNFQEESKIIFGVGVPAQNMAEFQLILDEYYEALDKKTSPDLRGHDPMAEIISIEQIQEDPQCYQRILDNYPDLLK